MVLLAKDTDGPNNFFKTVKVLPRPNCNIVRPVCRSGVTEFEFNFLVSFFYKIEFDFQYQIGRFLF